MTFGAPGEGGGVVGIRNLLYNGLGDGETEDACFSSGDTHPTFWHHEEGYKVVESPP